MENTYITTTTVIVQIKRKMALNLMKISKLHEIMGRGMLQICNYVSLLRYTKEKGICLQNICFLLDGTHKKNGYF
jgi:hypothetical protein